MLAVALFGWLGCTSDDRVGALVADRREGLALGQLHLADVELVDAELAAVLLRSDVPALVEVHLAGNRLSGEGLAVLAGEKTSGLTWLDLTTNPLGADGLEGLRGAGFWSSLSSLYVAGAGLEQLGVLAEARALRDLHVGGQAVGGQLGVLAGLEVARLWAPEVGLDAASAAPLLALDGLVALELDGNPLDGLALDVGPGSLRSLSVEGCGLGPDTLAPLTGKPRSSLRHLVLSDNGLGDEGLAHLAGLSWLSELRSLEVARVGAGDAARQALAEAWGDRPGLTL